MTLRARLVAVTAGLLIVGFIAFGVVTYGRYSRSEYQRLDEQLKEVVSDAARVLGEGSGREFGRDDDPRSAQGRRPSFNLHYALFDQDSTTSIYQTSTDGPVLTELPAAGSFATVEDASADDGRWRVHASEVEFRDSETYTVVVSAPIADVERSLRGLAMTELVTGLILLAVLCVVAWMLLRRGLRPLEDMAGTARAISGGDLSQRVPATADPGEVGQLSAAMNTMLDDVQAAFAERDATEHRLRQFLADAAHELRTPLTSIRGFAELYRLGSVSPLGDRDVLVERIEAESKRMTSLVDDLLLLARIDRTRDVERVSIDLAVLGADACSAAAAIDRTRHITLDAPEPVLVLGDRGHLSQAIGNLVGNALRHTPVGSPIEVVARASGQTAELIVRDHGSGFSPEALVHAFDRFWQQDPSRSGSGSGLGLSIVSGIVAEFGGSVSVANARDGGAVLTIRLPLATE